MYILFPDGLFENRHYRSRVAPNGFESILNGFNRNMESLYGSHSEPEVKNIINLRNPRDTWRITTKEDMGEDEHNYQFIGKVSDFYPGRPGAHGGLLKKDKKVTDDTKVSVTDTGDYRFLEGNVVRAMENPIDILDMTFYDAKISAARDCIDALGGYDNFINS